jgi:hypothetical protein
MVDVEKINKREGMVNNKGITLFNNVLNSVCSESVDTLSYSLIDLCRYSLGSAFNQEVKYNILNTKQDALILDIVLTKVIKNNSVHGISRAVRGLKSKNAIY